LAYTFGKRKDKVFSEFMSILEPFGISMFYTDDWCSYQRNLEKLLKILLRKGIITDVEYRQIDELNRQTFSPQLATACESICVITLDILNFL